MTIRLAAAVALLLLAVLLLLVFAPGGSQCSQVTILGHATCAEGGLF